MRRFPTRPSALFTALAGLVVLLLAGAGPACRTRARVVPLGPAGSPGEADFAGYRIQVGAFAVEENAERLTRALRDGGWNAFSVFAETRVFKVQVGSYATRAEAVRAAGDLVRRNLAAEFLIVPPGAEIVPVRGGGSEEAVRDRLAATALGFVEFPYVWGGTSPEEGFDCSGLAMTVFRMNGIPLPRSLAGQVEAGREVAAGRAKKGDLVFFSIGRTGRASHVGVMIGGDRFIHAPGRGKTIRPDSLANPYFRDRLLEIRSYV